MTTTDGIDAMIHQLGAIGDSANGIAKVAAPLMEAAVKKTAAAGTSPDGTPWRSKKDGDPALKNAAQSVQGRAIGSVVELRLVGTATGDAKVQAIQNARRPILPKPGMAPAPVAEALQTAARQYFEGIR